MDEKLISVTPISPGYNTQAPARRTPVLGCFAVGAGIALFLSLLLNFALIGAKASGIEQGPASFHEKVIAGEGDAKIVEISVEGIIADHQESGGLLGMTTSESLPHRIWDQLDKATKDEAVKAIILDVNSPGGTVTASDEIWNYLVKFRDLSKKPLVVHQGALAASGGYYISSAADEIVCEETTITGSIGVIMQGMNFAKLMTDHGVSDVTIKSGPNKDLLNPFSEVRAEHVKILQETVDEMYDRFCNVVAQGIAHRTKAKIEDVLPDVKKLADGRIYTAKQALKLKLVDKIGYLEDAIEDAKSLANLKTAKLIRYTKQPTFMDVLSGNVDSKLDLGQGISVRIDPALLDELRSPRFLMLWRGE